MKTKEESSPKDSKRRSRSTSSELPLKQSKLESDVTDKNETNKHAKVKRPMDNLDVAVINFEEEQSIQRDSHDDLQEFQETCMNISKCVSQINNMKAEGKGQENSDLMNKRREAMLLTTNLRKLNRYAQIRERKAKENTITVKNKVDALHLDLQNLLYEIMHMKREIKKCMNFSSRDEEIDLVDVDTFYNEAPEDITKPGTTKNDTHSQMLARLDWELHERKVLSSQKNDLIGDKKAREQEIVQKTEYLKSLKPRLEEIVKATKPVQEYMNLPLGVEKLMFETAQYLPRPLYVLYIQVKAFKDACDKNMLVKIVGDLDQAKSELHSKLANDDIESGDEGDNAEVIEIDVNSEGRTKRKSNKEKEKSRFEENKKRILKRHPLSLNIKIVAKDEFDVSLDFYYLPILHIATVEIKVNISDNVKVDRNSELLSNSEILQDLLTSDDGGKISPNPSNKYQLEKYSMGTFSSYQHEIGYAYFWVQWICGLNYLPLHDVKSYTPDASLSTKHFQSVLKAIKRRINTRISLQTQLQQLDMLTIPTAKDDELNSSCKVVCHLTRWKRILYDDLQTARYMEYIELGLIDESCVIYEAVLTREETVRATIVLHNNYPHTPPLMILTMQETRNTEVDWKMFIRSVESEVNAYTEELTSNHGNNNYLLSKMLKKLQICFDIFVETGPSHSTKDKLYARKTKGRDRNKPYKHHADGYFTHR